MSTNPGALRATEEEFRELMYRKVTAIDGARFDLLQRVREFVDKHARNGGKGGRSDYSKLIALSEFEPLRIALDEYDRVRTSKPEEYDHR